MLAICDDWLTILIEIFEKNRNFAHLQSPTGEQLPQRPCFHSPWPPLVSDSPQPSPDPAPFPIFRSCKCKNIAVKNTEMKVKV